MSNLLEAALAYREIGLSIIPTDALKQSLVKWGNYQRYLPSEAELRKMFAHPATACIATVTGRVSGNMEVIDIDSKYDLQGRLMERLFTKIKGLDKDLAEKLVIAQSRSGGYHFYYRSKLIGRNQPLAKRPVTEEEKVRHPKDKTRILIETRGEGGYIVIPPSPGYCFLQHDLHHIPTISAEQRQILLDSARLFNQYVEQKLTRHSPKIDLARELSPLDDYNLRGDVIELLQKRGWTIVQETDKRTVFKRPGDTDKRSSGDFNHELGLFSVFSTSTEFEPGRGYRPYAVYTMLECGGDFKEAVKRLAKEGYGHSPPYSLQKNRGYYR